MDLHRAVWQLLTGAVVVFLGSEVLRHRPCLPSAGHVLICFVAALALAANRRLALGARRHECPRFAPRWARAWGLLVAVAGSISFAFAWHEQYWTFLVVPLATLTAGYWLLSHAGREAQYENGRERDGFFPAG